MIIRWWFKIIDIRDAYSVSCLQLHTRKASAEKSQFTPIEISFVGRILSLKSFQSNGLVWALRRSNLNVAACNRRKYFTSTASNVAEIVNIQLCRSTGQGKGTTKLNVMWMTSRSPWEGRLRRRGKSHLRRVESIEFMSLSFAFGLAPSARWRHFNEVRYWRSDWVGWGPLKWSEDLKC